jgi:hypothetical protein
VSAGEVWDGGGFTLALLNGTGECGVNYCGTGADKFNFRNKFIILPPGLLVDNNTF